MNDRDEAIFSRDSCDRLGRVSRWTNPRPGINHFVSNELGFGHVSLRLASDDIRNLPISARRSLACMRYT